MDSPIAPISPLTRRPALTGSDRGIGSPGFPVTVGYAAGVDLPHTGSNRAADRIRSAIGLTKGLRHTLIPTTTLRDALVVAPTLGHAGGYAARNGMRASIANRRRDSIAVGSRAANRACSRIVHRCTLTPSLRAICSRRGTTGIAGRAVNNKDAAAETGGGSLGRAV